MKNKLVLIGCIMTLITLLFGMINDVIYNKEIPWVVVGFTLICMHYLIFKSD